MPRDDRAIAICATFTAEAIQPAMAFWAHELGLDPEIRFAGYGQIFQELLDPAGLFTHNRGYNIALVRFEDWAQAGIEDSASRLIDALRAAASHATSPLIVVTCPSRLVHQQASAAAEAALREAIAHLPAVHLIAYAELEALYPVAEIHDAHADELGHVPYTPLFFAALATALARRIHALSAAPFKVIALDCDDTLWAGICGEDGPQGVVLDAPRQALQEFMAERRRQGLLLALASKNNEEDVAETFRAHPEMPLRLEDFVARRINWGAKGHNLASMAEELGLGLDSFIFVDDNPMECREAQAAVPEVLALALPERPEEIPEFLRHVWAFDRAHLTVEDLRRSELYASEARRTEARRTAASLEEFLASLALEIEIAPMTPEQAPRVAQLTQRTNQMNASLARRTEPEIRALEAHCLTVSVRDRFGDYGLTGVAIYRPKANALFVDTFLLSCRVLGRGVEQRMVERLWEIARSSGLEKLEVAFLKGPRNRPAQLFLQSIGEYSDGTFRIGPIVRASSPAAPGDPLPSEPAIPAKRIDYSRIATELRTPEAVLACVHAAAAFPSPARREAPVAPRTPLETELVQLWAQLLNVSAVGIHDDFFELGGHSLLAVQLLSRVRQITGVDLSLEVIYSGDFTVSELAQAVELKELEQSGGEYQDLLRELEAMTDEEARALLAEEQDAS